MTFEEFDAFQSRLFTEVETMKSSKGKEYANSKDRFANFNRLAEELGLKNYQVGWVYTKKHLDAIAQYCRTQETHSTESIRGRFVDAICYLTLMAGMVEEIQLKNNTPSLRAEMDKLFGESLDMATGRTPLKEPFPVNIAEDGTPIG